MKYGASSNYSALISKKLLEANGGSLVEKAKAGVRNKEEY
jgi:hypothetical protein